MGRADSISAGILLLIGICIWSACRNTSPSPHTSQSGRRVAVAGRTPVRVTMADLHQAGGVPRGWRLSPPPGDVNEGRRLFVELGCVSCHVVRGEPFSSALPDEQHPGPELTGMGSHHPPEYFAEAIMNPDAVLVEGPGYISASGHSAMPEYPDITLQQLGDLVAYLKSLGGAAEGRASSAQAPDQLAYFAQAFDVDDQRIDEFYAWFERQEFNKVSGLVRIDSFASRLHDGRHTVLCMFAFTDEAAVQRFLAARIAITPPGDFIRPVDHPLFESPPLYRAIQMSEP